MPKNRFQKRPAVKRIEKKVDNEVKAVAKEVKAATGARGGRGRKRAQMAPLAFAKGERSFANPRITRTNDNTQVISHREYLGPVSGSVGFELTPWRVNPGLPDPCRKISNTAKMFDDYTCQEIKMHFVTRCPATSAGSVMMAFLPNPDESVPTTQVDMAQLASYTNEVIWKETTNLHVSPVNLSKQKTLKVRSNDQTPADNSYILYDVGWIMIAVSSTTDQSGARIDKVGDLYVDFKFVLKTPNTDNLDEYGTEIFWTSFAPTERDHPLGVDYMYKYKSAGVFDVNPIAANVSGGVTTILVYPLSAVPPDNPALLNGFIFKVADPTDINVLAYVEGDEMTGVNAYFDGVAVPNDQMYRVLDSSGAHQLGYYEYKRLAISANGAGGLTASSPVTIDPKWYGWHLVHWTISGPDAVNVINFNVKLYASKSPFYPDLLPSIVEEDIGKKIMSLLTPKQRLIAGDLIKAQAAQYKRENEKVSQLLTKRDSLKDILKNPPRVISDVKNSVASALISASGRKTSDRVPLGSDFFYNHDGYPTLAHIVQCKECQDTLKLGASKTEDKDLMETLQDVMRIAETVGTLFA